MKTLAAEKKYHEPGHTHSDDHVALLGLRLLSLITLAVMLTIHIRSVRVFRWEHSFSGGVLVTYVMAVTGLALCAGIEGSGAKVLQVYLCGTGGVLLAINAITIWHRWRIAGDMTRVVAELLETMGVSLRRQVLLKASLSAAAAFIMFIDLTWTLLLFLNTQPT